MRGWVGWAWLGLPLVYFAGLFAWPLVSLLRMGFSVPQPMRITGEGWSLENFRQIFTNPLYLECLWTTVRISLVVAAATLALGFPLALFLSRTTSRYRGILLSLTLAPILISVVVRAYGWIVLLANRGLVNSALMQLGVIARPIRLVFNETGVEIATTHVLLPFMVLAIMGSLQGVQVALEEAAASLGARRWRVLLDVVLPLSLPGVAAGTLLVFILSASSFVTPVLLGGQVVLTVPMLALQQFTTTFNWAFGSALTMLLLVTVIGITVVFDGVLRRRLVRGAA
jgi:putative spermidine/putrescine transport system permease protein